LFQDYFALQTTIFLVSNSFCHLCLWLYCFLFYCFLCKLLMR